MRQNSQTVSPMSNEGRNLYVVEHITAAILSLMKTTHLNDISISQICSEAGVGRASFYRNFESKEDVIRKHLKYLLDEWWIQAIQNPNFNFIEAIFEHYWSNRDLCLLLNEQNLSNLILESIKVACGPKPEHTNIEAYTTAYFSYGLFGWIDEWFRRGMTESPKEMYELWLNAQSPSNP